MIRQKRFCSTVIIPPKKKKKKKKLTRLHISNASQSTLLQLSALYNEALWKCAEYWAVAFHFVIKSELTHPDSVVWLKARWLMRPLEWEGESETSQSSGPALGSGISSYATLYQQTSCYDACSYLTLSSSVQQMGQKDKYSRGCQVLTGCLVCYWWLKKNKQNKSKRMDNVINYIFN